MNSSATRRRSIIKSCLAGKTKVCLKSAARPASGHSRVINMAELTGRRITVYRQNEVVKDLIAASANTSIPLLFEVGRVSVDEVDSKQPIARTESLCLVSRDVLFPRANCRARLRLQRNRFP